jgi:hypothetical protein
MMEAQFMPQGHLLHDHHEFWLLAFGRLKPGVALKASATGNDGAVEAGGEELPGGT